MKSSGVAAVLLFASLASADGADDFFDDSYVHEIRLYFDDADWYSTLYESHASDPEDPYSRARFVSHDVDLDSVGVRFKGNSSFGVRSVKKSFKIDFNLYDEGFHFFGLKKLNLNNGFKDPTLLREKLFLDFAGRFVPTIRAVHTRLYVNDAYWGLYTAVEQIDAVFTRSRFGADEDGILYKAQSSDEGSPTSDFGSDLSWLGDDPEAYAEVYQLKTNEETNDYTDLIEFIKVLNTTPSERLLEEIEPLFDVRTALRGLALNHLFVNLDAYCTSGHNYYLYDRDDTGRLTHLLWDTNEAFGAFSLGATPGQDLTRLPPLWLPASIPGVLGVEYPLLERLWEIDELRQYYLDAMAHMLANGFDAGTMGERIARLADTIRPDVYADPNKLYTSAAFEANLTSDYREPGPMGTAIYGLESFVERRAQYLLGVLDPLDSVPVLWINEIVAKNETVLRDPTGDFGDWVELYNPGPIPVDLAGYLVTDGDETPWRIPSGSSEATTVAAGGFILVWFDGHPERGPLHVSAKLSAEGEGVYLYAPDGVQPVDAKTFGEQYADVSLNRFPDGSAEWSLSVVPTPVGPNRVVEVLPGCTDSLAVNHDPEANVSDGSCVYAPPADRILVINEILASNSTTNVDESGDADDWIELYFRVTEPLSLAGFTLTDDLSDPDGWPLPDVTISGEGYLVVWADRDEQQGPWHASFKLSASDGEVVALFDPTGALVDWISFGVQTTDVSYGRLYDGALAWVFFEGSTPGAPNPVLFPEAVLVAEADDIELCGQEVTVAVMARSESPSSSPLNFAWQTSPGGRIEGSGWSVVAIFSSPGAHLVECSISSDGVTEARELLVNVSECEAIHVRMGDVDCDTQVNLTDPICLLAYLFQGGSDACGEPCCTAQLDANADDRVDIADAIQILQYLFLGGGMMAPDGSLVEGDASACVPYPAAELILPCAAGCSDGTTLDS